MIALKNLSMDEALADGSRLTVRRTTIKSRETGEDYYTFRLVDSVRAGARVRQRTLLNLGRHFDIDRADWGMLTQRIEHILDGQLGLIPLELDARLEAEAQRLAALLIHSRGESEGAVEASDFHCVNVNSLERVRPRSVGGGSFGLATVTQMNTEHAIVQPIDPMSPGKDTSSSLPVSTS